MTRIARIAAFCIALSSMAVTATAATIVPSPPQLGAKAFLLIDANSGAVLAEENADMPLPPASLTKMMTSYVLSAEVAAGRASDDDEVNISENAWSQNPIFQGSSLMWIEPGKPVTLGELHLGVVVSSGNDATVAIAEHLAGSESAFADMMNGHARALGMQDTYYVNSHGLPDPDHITTARDLATLAAALINNYPEHYDLYKIREYTYNDIKQYNRNTLLAEDPSVDGLKTGYTQEAGYGLVASAERRGMRLISVVMGTSSANARKNETRSLLNYGFRFFETLELFAGGEELDKPRVWKGKSDYLSVGVSEPVVLTVPRGKRKNLDTQLEEDSPLEAPIALGDRVGTVKVVSGGEVLAELPLVALEAVEENNFFARLWDMILMWIASIFAPV